MNKIVNIAIVGLGQVGIYLYNELRLKKKEIDREKEIIRSSKSKAKVVSIETKKMSNGRTIKIITLQEPEDLTETIVKESNKKYSDISRRYLEGPLNPKSRKKVKEDISPDVIKSFTIQDNLNPKIWENGKLKVEILKKLRKIGMMQKSQAK